MPSTYLIPAILCTLLCCLPTGVVAIVFAARVTSKWNAGDVAGATEASNRAKTWSIVSVAAGLVVGAIYAVIAIAASSGSGGS
jgi:uncharacterized membrane protein YjgN (DUF898 family)